MFAEWRVQMIFLKASFSMRHYGNASIKELAAFSCLLMHASLYALTTLPMVFKLHQNTIFPLWPIIPHKEQGEFQFTSIQKHLLLFILSLGMLPYTTTPLSSCPVRPTLSSLEPTELQSHMLNLLLPSPWLALTYQLCWCPTMSASTELQPSYLNLVAVFNIRDVHLLEY